MALYQVIIKRNLCKFDGYDSNKIMYNINLKKKNKIKEPSFDANYETVKCLLF